jgi:hypothetical protein
MRAHSEASDDIGSNFESKMKKNKQTKNPTNLKHIQQITDTK